MHNNKLFLSVESRVLALSTSPNAIPMWRACVSNLALLVTFKISDNTINDLPLDPGPETLTPFAPSGSSRTMGKTNLIKESVGTNRATKPVTSLLHSSLKPLAHLHNVPTTLCKLTVMCSSK